MKNLRSCNQYKGRVFAKEGDGVSVVEGRKRRSKRIHTKTTEKRIYLTLKVVTNSTGVLCREEGW